MGRAVLWPRDHSGRQASALGCDRRPPLLARRRDGNGLETAQERLGRPQQRHGHRPGRPLGARPRRNTRRAAPGRPSGSGTWPRARWSASGRRPPRENPSRARPGPPATSTSCATVGSSWASSGASACSMRGRGQPGALDASPAGWRPFDRERRRPGGRGVPRAGRRGRALGRGRGRRALRRRDRRPAVGRIPREPVRLAGPRRRRVRAGHGGPRRRRPRGAAATAASRTCCAATPAASTRWPCPPTGVGGVHERERDPALAHAGPDEAPAPHATVRRADGAPASDDEPAGRRRRDVLTGYKVEVGPFPGWKDVPSW